MSDFDVMAGMAAMNQRNQILAQQRAHVAALESQLSRMRQTEAERLVVERARLQIEAQRAEAEATERELRREELERLKEIRKFMAETIVAFGQLKRHAP